MVTFLVRVFVADDLRGLEGTIERPGADAIVFHDATDLVRQLTAIIERGHHVTGRPDTPERHEDDGD